MARVIRIDVGRLEELQRVLVRLSADLTGVPDTPAHDLGSYGLEDAARNFAAAWDARRRSTADALMDGATTIAETRQALELLDQAHRSAFA